MLRPATPLTILLLVAFGLLILSIISTPVVRFIPLASFAGVDFGVFGFCKGTKCSSIELGYDTSSLLNDAESATFDLPSSARASLSSILLVHPIAALLTLVMLILAASAHFHGASHSSKYLLVLFILSIITLVTALLSFLIDVLLFVPHLAWGSYSVLAATILVAMSGIMSCAMRRTLVSRKANQKRIAENAEMNGDNFYNRLQRNPDDPSHGTAVLGTALGQSTPDESSLDLLNREKDLEKVFDEKNPSAENNIPVIPISGRIPDVSGISRSNGFPGMGGIANRNNQLTHMQYQPPDHGMDAKDPQYITHNRLRDNSVPVQGLTGSQVIRDDYAIPRGGLVPPSNGLVPRSIGFGPPRGGYGPPRGANTPSRGTQGPPRGTQGPPRGTQGPPRGAQGPPRGAPGPPRGAYGPPRGAYGTPRGPPGPPRGAYGPPRGSFGPPRGSYGPPRGAYGPLRGGNGFRVGDYQPRGRDYEPPERGYELQGREYESLDKGYDPYEKKMNELESMRDRSENSQIYEAPSGNFNDRQNSSPDIISRGSSIQTPNRHIPTPSSNTYSTYNPENNTSLPEAESPPPLPPSHVDHPDQKSNQNSRNFYDLFRTPEYSESVDRSHDTRNDSQTESRFSSEDSRKDDMSYNPTKQQPRVESISEAYLKDTSPEPVNHSRTQFSNIIRPENYDASTPNYNPNQSDLITHNSSKRFHNPNQNDVSTDDVSSFYESPSFSENLSSNASSLHETNAKSNIGNHRETPRNLMFHRKFSKRLPQDFVPTNPEVASPDTSNARKDLGHGGIHEAPFI